jgi:hypothetical protein
MLRPRKVIDLCSLASVIFLGVPLVYCLLTPHPAITEENFHKLKHGMTRPEVEAILNAPAGEIFYDWHDKGKTAAEIDALAKRTPTAVWWGA